MRLNMRSGAMTLRALWFGGFLAALCAGFALLPGADAGSFPTGIPEVSAAGTPNLFWLSQRETPALASIKANATVGSPAISGPSANIGQTIQLKGAALGPGVASFEGYSGVAVTSPLVSVKVGKKGKTVVPPNAVSGGVGVIPDGGVLSTTLPLQIVPTIGSISSKTVSSGDELTINGSGFTPNLEIRFPGVAAAVSPSNVDGDSAVVTVPAGVQKGKLSVSTTGGTSNTSKIKVTAASFANRSLATDTETGAILVVDDIANTLSEIDPLTEHVVRTADIPSDMEWVSVSPGTGVAVVGNDSGATMFFDLAAWAPYHVRAGDGKSYLARSDELVIDETHNLIEDPLDGWSFSLGPLVEVVKRTPDGSHAVALAGDIGTIYVVDLKTRAVSAVRRFDGPIEGVTIGVDGRIYTIDRTTGRLLSTAIE